MKFSKKLNDIMVYVSISALLTNLIWFIDEIFPYSLDRFIDIFLIFIAFGVPLLIFILLKISFKKEDYPWDKTNLVFHIIYSSLFLIMFIHTTIYGIIDNIYNAIGTYPLIYMVFLFFVAIIWFNYRIRPNKNDKIIAKILYALPVLSLFIMTIHCSIITIIELSNIINHSYGITSFPWWTMPLMVGLIYLIIATILFVIYIIYHLFSKKNIKVEKKQ